MIPQNRWNGNKSILSQMKRLIRRAFPAALILLVFSLLLVWLELTPDGLLGKMDAVGFAVCHQIPERTFTLADRPLPLCARCSGMYLGAFIGLLYHFLKGRSGRLPVRSAWIPLLILAFLFTIDGINSYFTFFNPQPILYEPQNWLRLISGSGLGLGNAAVLAPSFNQAVWLEVTKVPILGSWKAFTGLLIAALLLDLALITGNPLLVYPLTILSGLTVMAILVFAYTTVWVLVTRRDNTFRTWNQLRWHLLAGIGTALLQIGLVDVLRYAFAGGWVGF